MEKWKDIEGLEGCYQISNCGRVKSLERYAENGRKVNERILKTRINKQGYEYVCVQKNKKRIAIKVHREVAKAFISNPNDYVEVNHKDENKLNNHVNNLEWCDRKYNANYGTAIKRASLTRSLNHILLIEQFDMEGSFIKTWKGPREVEVETNNKMRATNIIACCRGKYKTSYGFIWKYKDDKQIRGENHDRAKRAADRRTRREGNC